MRRKWVSREAITKRLEQDGSQQKVLAQMIRKTGCRFGPPKLSAFLHHKIELDDATRNVLELALDFISTHARKSRLPQDFRDPAFMESWDRFQQRALAPTVERVMSSEHEHASA